MALKLPVLNVNSSSDVGITVPGLTQIEWTDVPERSKLGEGSVGEVYSAKIYDKRVVVKKLRRQKKTEGERFICERSADSKRFAL